MDVWAGDIELPGGGSIQEVELVATRAVGPSFDRVSLRFLAVVDVARVPLHLAIGSPLNVYSQSDATQDWFSALLLGGHATAKNAEPWWQAATAQSPVGILTEVTRENGDSPSPNPTEILFYAAGSGAGSTDTLSPEELNLRINALPLSSDLLHKLPAVATPPLSPQLPVFKSGLDDVCAEFLPPLFDPPEVQEANTRKRQSVSSIFDEATERRKRARRHGGESISAAASKVNGPVLPLQHKRSTSSMGLQELFDPQNHVRDVPSRPTSSEGIKPGRKISRSPSLSIDPQALTRKGLLDGQQGKRSSLSRVTSVADPAEEPTTESRNKDIISRLVMAGMRMYGLQQRKKPSRPRKGSMASDVATSSYPTAAEDATISPEDAAKDEEYKLVYHQAYRGTVFAMRNHIATTSLNPHIDHLRETVDKLLAIFCTDPLAPGTPVEEPTTMATGTSMTLTPRPKQQLFGTPKTMTTTTMTGFEDNPFDRQRESFGGGGGGSGGGLKLVHTPETRKGKGLGLGLGKGG